MTTFTDHNGILAWTFDYDTSVVMTMDADKAEWFDSARPVTTLTQGDRAPAALVNTLYGPGETNP